MIKTLLLCLSFSLWSSTLLLAWNSPGIAVPGDGATVNTGVTLDWNAVASSKGYTFQLDTSANFDSPVLRSVNITYINSVSSNADTRYATSNLFFGETYYWRVRAYITGDTSVWNTRSFITRDFVPLYGPNNTTTNASTTLDWGAHPGCSFYDWEMDTTNQFNSPVLQRGSNGYINNVDANNDTKATVGSLYFDQIYYWRVRGRNGADTSIWQTATFTTTGTITLAGPIAGVNLFVGTTIDWNAFPGSSFYDWEVDTTASFNSPVLKRGSKAYINNVSSNADTQESITNLFFNKKHYWRVRGRNASDSTAWFSSHFTTIDYVTLNAPADNGTANIGATLDWNTHVGVSHYDWELDTTNAFNSPALLKGSNAYINNVSGNADTEKYLNSLYFSKKHYWRVRPRNAVDTGAWVGRSFTTLEQLTLVSPANEAINIPTTSIKLDWSAMVGTSVYQIQVDTTNLFDSPNLIQVNKNYVNSNSTNTDTEYTMTGLKPQQAYFWRVRLINPVDTSMWFARAFTTGNTPIVYPAAPASFSPSNDILAPGEVMLDWQDVTGGTEYIYEFSTDANFSDKVSDRISTTEATMGQLAAGSYFWRVRTISNGIVGNWSPVQTFEIAVVSGVLSSNNAPVVFPNPCADHFTVNLPSGNYDLVIFNQMGAVVKKENSVSGTVHYSTIGLEKGIYYLQLNGPVSQTTQKLLIE